MEEEEGRAILAGISGLTHTPEQTTGADHRHEDLSLPTWDSLHGFSGIKMLSYLQKAGLHGLRCPLGLFLSAQREGGFSPPAAATSETLGSPEISKSAQLTTLPLPPLQTASRLHVLRGELGY